MSGEVSVLSGAPVVDVNPITGEIQGLLALMEAQKPGTTEPVRLLVRPERSGISI
jgi:hypothetical protein